MADDHDVRLIYQWLLNLARLTRYRQGKLSDEEMAALKDELRIYALVLAGCLPPAAFTTDSLACVVEGNSHFPAAADIRVRLQGWWEAHRPSIAPQIAGLSGEHLNPMDLSWLNRYWKSQCEILEDGYMPRWGSVEADIANLLSLIKQYSLPAWQRITGDPSMVILTPEQRA